MVATHLYADQRWQGIDVEYQQCLHMYIGDQRWLQMDVRDQPRLQMYYILDQQ